VELLVKSEILTSCIYGPTFGKAESRLFLFDAPCFNTESIQKVILWHSCVNTLLATKFTLITDGIYFGSLRVKQMSNCSVFIVLGVKCYVMQCCVRSIDKPCSCTATECSYKRARYREKPSNTTIKYKCPGNEGFVARSVKQQ
jgi:hypothetical protein